jgi:ABC-2 type transport system ATP-binding protein
MLSVIETKDLTKKYGDMFAIKSIELKLDQGDLYGFIGPNGAGKTTTMRIIATLLNPTWGEAYVCGNSIYTKPKEIRRLVGFMPDFFGVYDDMTVIEYLEFFAAAYRIQGPERKKRCNEMLEIVDLDFKRDAYANTLSRGQTQRLGLARTLLHDPQVLLLDEPLSGLDPRARIEMRGVLRRLGQLGKTIIVSSHILPELADICNKVGIIDRGVLIVNESVDNVMRRVRERTVLYIAVTNGLDAAMKLLSDHTIVDKVEAKNGQAIVTLKKDIEDYSELPTLLVSAGHKLTLFREEEVNLESAFMALTKGTGAKI